MSTHIPATHIPADYFTKPILARLGVGKTHGCNGWIAGLPVLTRIRGTGDGEWGEWVTPIHWDHDGIDNGPRAFCGALAPSGVGRWTRVEGPHLPPDRQQPPPYTVAQRETGRAYTFYGETLEAWFPGELVVGYVSQESLPVWRARVETAFLHATKLHAPEVRHTSFATGAAYRPSPQAQPEFFERWKADNAAVCRRLWRLFLPRVAPPEGWDPVHGSQVPDLGAITCAKCLAAWDVFAESEGGEIRVIPPTYDTENATDDDDDEIAFADRDALRDNE